MAVFIELVEARRLMSAASHVAPRPLIDARVGETVTQALGALRASGPDAYHGRPVTVSVRWGDHTKSTGLPASYSAEAGGFVAAGSHRYATAGEYQVTIAFHRGPRALGRYHDTLAVSGNPGGATGLSGRAGRPVGGSIGTFVKGAFPPYTPVVDWGDGTRSDAALSEAGTTTYAVRGSHTYAAPGTYRVAVSVVYTFRPTPAGQPDIGAPVQTVDVIQTTITIARAGGYPGFAGGMPST
jgi:hypothetical protein